MGTIEKEEREELEDSLKSHFATSDLNGFVAIAVGEAYSDYHLAVANGKVIANECGYLYTLAKNKILNEVKRLGKFQRIGISPERDSLLASLTTFENDGEMKLVVEEVMDMISEKSREALLLHYRDEYDLKETAEKLGISLAAVKKRIHEGKTEAIRILRRKIIENKENTR